MPKQVDEQAQIARIVQATCTVLATHGIDGLNLRAVAQAAGCTTGLLMHWFASKADLVQAALAHTVTVQNERVERRLEEHPEDVEGAIAEFLPLDDQRRAEARIGLSFTALAVSTPALLLDRQQRYAHFRQEIVDYLRHIQFRSADPNDVVDRIFAITDGISACATLDPTYWIPQRQRAVLAANIGDVVECAKRFFKVTTRTLAKKAPRRLPAKRRTMN